MPVPLRPRTCRAGVKQRRVTHPRTNRQSLLFGKPTDQQFDMGRLTFHASFTIFQRTRLRQRLRLLSTINSPTIHYPAIYYILYRMATECFEYSQIFLAAPISRETRKTRKRQKAGKITDAMRDGSILTLLPLPTRRNTGRGRPVNSQPGRLRYVAQASPPASSGSVPLPVWWDCRDAPGMVQAC